MAGRLRLDFDLNIVDDSELGKFDRADILLEARPITANWKSVFIMLRVDPDELDVIESVNWKFPAKALDEATKLWLNKAYNVKKLGPPSWRKLVAAIAEPAGGNNPRLAKDIAMAHLSETPPPEMPQSPSSSVPTQETLGQDSENQYPWFPESDQKVVHDGEGDLKHIYYSPYPKKHPKLVLSFGSVSPESKKGERKYDSYDMKRTPHGVAVIINNMTFKSHKNRKGSDIDERNATQAFRYLGYHVMVYRDLKASQFLELFEKLSREDHTNYDSFVCCILSHGTEKGAYGTDSVVVDLKEIGRKMNGHNCTHLSGKPKIFFLQTCRGKASDFGAVTHDGDDESPIVPDSDRATSVVDDSGEFIPDEADFFFGYATPDGKKAWRDELNGSWYITELCRYLCLKGSHTDLYHLVQKVHDVVAKEYEHQGMKMMPEVVTRLRADVYFFPK